MATEDSPDTAQPPRYELPPEFIPWVEDLVTEDDTPKDSIYSEKQQRLLIEPLYSSWNAGRPFVATANVGLFYADRQPPLVPDTLLSLDVVLPKNLLLKKNRSYFMWEYGKAPEAVIEIVSDKEGGETTDKMLKYAQIGILYYAIYDPWQEVQAEPLRVFVLRDKTYVPCPAQWLPILNLGLTLWHGRFENWETMWLRWCDREGRVIPTGAERADLIRQRVGQETGGAETERQWLDLETVRADEARQCADQARQRADRLAAQLRELGFSPEET